MNNLLDKEMQSYKPVKAEYVLLGLDIVLLLLLAVRLIDPLFLDGQLLPSMACAFVPGAVMTVLRRPALTTHRLCFALGLLVFLVANGTINLEEIGGALNNWPWVLGGILLLSSQTVTGAFRWQLLLKEQSISMSILTNLRLLLVGCFFNTFIPGSTGGDFYRIYKVAKGNRVSVASVTTSVFLDRLLGLPPLLLIIFSSVLLNLDFVSGRAEFLTLVQGYGVLTAVSTIVITGVFCASFFLAEKLRSYNMTGLIGRNFMKVVESLEVYKNAKMILFWVVLISIVSHLATLCAFLCFAKATGITGLGVSILVFLIFAGLSANFIPLAPGGAGQGELMFSWIFLLATPEIAENAHRAAVMMLCYRLGMLIYGGIGGLVYGLSRHDVNIDEMTHEVETTP